MKFSLVVAFALALCGSADARVTRFEVISRSDVLAGAAFGAAGPYEKIVGRATIATQPDLVANRAIVDLPLAPRNAAGAVESVADVVLLRPKNAATSTLLVEVPNRGGKGMLRYFDHAKSSPDPTTAEEFGDGFLLERGYTLAWIGWEWDIPPGPNRLHFAAPVATEHGRPIVGLVRSDFVPAAPVNDVEIGHQGMVPYAIADPNDARTVLTERDAIVGERHPIARDQWRFARWTNGSYTPDDTHVAMAGGFVPGHIYELVYAAKNPVVTGLGLAAIRDVVSYLKHDDAAPVHVSRAIGFGISQSGRVLRHMLYQGFNTDENGQLVFDGVFADVAGAGRGSFNHRFAQPSRDGPSSSSFFYQTDLFPFTDASEHDPFGLPDDGLLTHANAVSTPVKIVYSFGSYEYWSREASLTHTSADGTRDAAIPDNVRIYALAGTQHNHGLPARTTPFAQGPTNPNDFAWALRAMLVNLDSWIATGTPPPASRYPTVADNTLVPLARVAFPAITGYTLPTTYHHGFALDFGPQYRSAGIVTNEPARILGEYGVRFPQVDADGNELGSLRMPEVAVPLGTYTGWNLRRPETGLGTELVDFTGMYLPFASDRAARGSDPRPSIAERYPTQAAYLRAYEAEVRRLIAQRYLLPDDLDPLMAHARDLWNTRG